MRIAYTPRRARGPLVALGVAALMTPAIASATPTIESIKVSAGPIPGFPGTGDLPGAGALIHGFVRIAGSEYFGSPAPLVGVTFMLPAGTRLHQQGFTTCAAGVLKELGPSACPKRSAAGPPGSVLGTVSFGGERVPERATVQGFFAPGGGMEVFVDGKSPALVEIIAKGHIASAIPPFGQAVVGEVPLIATVPEAPYASFVEGTVAAGAAYRQGKKTISYITLPAHCPSGGWPVKAELRFFEAGEAVASAKLPCAR